MLGASGTAAAMPGDQQHQIQCVPCRPSRNQQQHPCHGRLTPICDEYLVTQTEGTWPADNRVC